MDNSGKLPAALPSMLETTMIRGPFGTATGTVPPAFPRPSVSSAEPPGLAAGPTFASLLHALRRRWLLATTVALVGGMLTAVAVFIVMPPKYSAEARLLVASRTEIGLGLQQREETEFAIFKSNLPSLLKAPLNLNSALNQPLHANTGRRVRDLAIVRERGSGAVEWLEKAIKTDYNLGPEILKVTLSAEQSDEVAELLNAIVYAFLNDLARKEKLRSEAFIEQLQRKQEELESELGNHRRRLTTLEASFKLPNLAEMKSKHDIAVTKLATVEKKYLDNRLELAAAKQTLESLRDRLQNPELIPVSEEELKNYVRNDPRFQDLFKGLAKAAKDLVDAELLASRNTAVIRRYREARDAIQRSIDAKIEELRPELEQAWRAKLVSELRLAEL
ncbi:MAG: Wzz/FepE/Etk N-terminal domain-containing protein, partial [Gemmataceae bacterium]|nr:Wzz/FepE/Etk N-terminal domain-containing protein [Gemmataceae bacterium]